MGIQNVTDSDGAGTLSLRAVHNGVGVGVTSTSYFERIPTGSGDEYLQMDNFDLHVAVRVLQVDAGAGRPASVWFRGGFAAVSSADFQLYGGSAGVEARTVVAGSVALFGTARYVRYQEELRAVELVTAVDLSILRVGYRWLRFNVGPPLKGPEVGLVWQF